MEGDVDSGHAGRSGTPAGAVVRARRLALVVGLAIALSATALAVLYLQDARDDTADLDVRRAESVAAALERDLTEVETVVRATSGFLARQRFATAAEFARFTEDLTFARSEPLAASVAWSPRVGPREPGPAYPVLYRHAIRAGEAPGAVDLAAEPTVAAAIRRAERSGAVALSAPVTLESGETGAVLVAAGLGPAPGGGRVPGVVTASFAYATTADALRRALPGVRFSVRDGDALLLGSADAPGDAARVEVVVGGRTWVVHAWGAPGGRVGEALLITGLGLVIAALVALLIARGGVRESRIAEEVVRRTQELAEARDRAASVVRQAQDGIAILSADMRLQEANDRYRELLALPGDRAEVEVDPLAAWDAADRAAVRAAVASALAGDVPGPVEARTAAGNGDGRWIRLAHAPLLPQRPEAGVVEVATDITERLRSERTEAALRRISLRVAAGDAHGDVLGTLAAEAQRLVAADGAWVVRLDDTDPDRMEVLGAAADPGFDRLAGVSAAVGRRLRIPVDGAVASVLRTGGEGRADGGDAGTNGVPAVVGSRLAVPIRVSGSLWGALVVARRSRAGFDADTGARLGRFAQVAGLAVATATARAELIEQATTDFVTRLANYRTFHERMGDLAERGGRPLTVMLIDVDGFGALAATHGHSTADAALALLADLLGSHRRPGDLLARIGGDEFGWVLPRTPAEEAAEIAEGVRARVAGYPFVRGTALTVSIGVAASAEPRVDREVLLRMADAALYWAKADGRDRVRVYDPDVMPDLTPEDRSRRLERELSVSALRALARAVDARDPDTREHSERVAALAEGLAIALGWEPEDARRLHDAGLVHDIGKIGVPDAVLFKPGRLTAEEFDQVRQHAVLGAEIVGDVLDAEQVRWVRHHHERVDGRGYPDGLAGDAIPLGARILCAADCFDVMISVRTYKSARPAGDAVAEMEACAGSQFDPRVVAALVRSAEVLGLAGAPAPRR